MTEKKEKSKLTWQEVVAKTLPLLGAVLLASVLCLLIHLGSEDGITAEQIGLVLLAVGALMGIRRGSNGSGTTAAGALLITVTTLFACGCGAACQTERTIVDALGAGMEAADGVVGESGGEEYQTASVIAHGAHGLGEAAVDACELLRDGSGWQAWVSLALEAAQSVATLIDGAGPADIAEPVPPELDRAIELLELEIQHE